MISVSSAFTASSTAATEGSPVGRSKGRGLARAAAAMLATGLVAAGTIVGATAASAAPGDESGQHQGGAVATLDGLKTYGTAQLNTGKGKKPQELPAGLFEMKVDGGGTIQTYCIDFHTPTKDGAKYLETPWDQSSLGANSDSRQGALDPAALLPAGQRLRCARQAGRYRSARREDRRHAAPRSPSGASRTRPT